MNSIRPMSKFTFSPQNCKYQSMSDTRKRFESYLPKYSILWRSIEKSAVQRAIQQELSSSITCSPSFSSTSSSLTERNLSHLLLAEDKSDEAEEKEILNKSSSHETLLLFTSDISDEAEEEISNESLENDSYISYHESSNENEEKSDEEGSILVESKCISPIVDPESITKNRRSLKKSNFIVVESSENEDFNYHEDESLCSEESEFKCCDDDEHDDERLNEANSVEHNEESHTPKSRAHSANSNSTAKSSMSKTQFKKQRERLGKEAFAEFNKAAFNNSLSEVSLLWSKNLRTTSGITRLKRYRKDNTREASIELSIKVIDDISRLRGTLLHEMCHAAQWLIDGVSKPPHGKCFKKWASIAMKHVKDVKVTVYHDYVIAYKYAWACSNPKCNVIVQRQSRSIDLNRQCCGKCRSKLMEIDVPKDKNNIDKENLKPRKKREPSVFNLFVKENSQIIRKRFVLERGAGDGSFKVSQSDVLKECSRLWNLKKNASANPIDVDELGREIQSVKLN